MTLRLLYVSEGSSDQGLRPHVEYIAAMENFQISLTAPDFALIAGRVGHSVADKLRAARELGGSYDVILVQRDADNQGSARRCEEISDAVAETWPTSLHVPIVPVRALEAWLLVDEALIRRVAGNPNGKVDLKLPKGKAVEGVVDPKKCLKEALAAASELRGRKLEIFQKRFFQNRHRLLELIDPRGALGEIPSWREFIEELRRALRATASTHEAP